MHAWWCEDISAFLIFLSTINCATHIPSKMTAEICQKNRLLHFKYWALACKEHYTGHNICYIFDTCLCRYLNDIDSISVSHSQDDFKYFWCLITRSRNNIQWSSPSFIHHYLSPQQTLHIRHIMSIIDFILNQ